MNILILSSIFPPHIFGGAEVAAYNMARLLVKLGHSVSVATLKEKDSLIKWGEMRPEGFRLYPIETARSYTLFGRTKKIAPWQKILWHAQDYFDVRNISNIKVLLDEVKPDQIDIHNLVGFGFNVLKEIGRRNIPVNYVLHDLNLACFHASMFKKGQNCVKPCNGCRLIGGLRQNALEALPRLAFISPSKANLDRVALFAPIVKRSKSAVIRNVPDKLPPLPEKTNSPVIRLLYVGRLDPVKGIDFLLSVLEKLSNKYTFQLEVLGRGPSEAALQARYAASTWVKFRGFVSSDEVAVTMAQADLFCMPSLWAEVYGLVTAQALQIGVPVIGSRTGGTVELVRDGETGMLVEPGDEAAWYAAFEQIFSNLSLLETWRQNTLKYKHQFDEEVIGDAYNKFSTLHHQP